MAMKVGAPLPPFDGEVDWLNDKPDIEKGFAPVLVHFWAMSCPSCKANMPDVQILRDKHPSIRFVAVHAPRSPDDMDIEKVRQMADEIGITEPCAIDNQHIYAERFELSGIWPYYFLFDSDGNLKRRGGGGMGLRLLTSLLAELSST